jgi:error-prone DNA polymerase
MAGGICALRLGLRLVSGLAQAHAEVIVERRAEGPFQNYDDFTHRTGLPNGVLKRLSRADAFGTLGLDRRGALWQSLPEQNQAPLFEHERSDATPTSLPPLSLQEQVLTDYQTAGLSLRGHPLQFVRNLLNELQVVKSCDLAHLPNDRRYKVAGLVLLRQRPGTAKGITFVTLEDEFGTANLIVRQAVWERFHNVAFRAGGMIAHGRLQRVGPVIHLLVDRMEDFTHLLAGFESRSRDFQ